MSDGEAGVTLVVFLAFFVSEAVDFYDFVCFSGDLCYGEADSIHADSLRTLLPKNWRFQECIISGMWC